MGASPIVGSDSILVHTATSDNEAAKLNAVDRYTNLVGSIRCIVHTIALPFNDLFQPGSTWRKYTWTSSTRRRHIFDITPKRTSD